MEASAEPSFGHLERASVGSVLAVLSDSPSDASHTLSHLLGEASAFSADVTDFAKALPSEVFTFELVAAFVSEGDPELLSVLIRRAAATAASLSPAGARIRRARNNRLLPLSAETAVAVLRAVSKDRRTQVARALAANLPLLFPFLAAYLSGPGLEAGGEVSVSAVEEALRVLRPAFSRPQPALAAMSAFCSAFSLASPPSPLAAPGPNVPAQFSEPAWPDVEGFFCELTPGFGWSQATVPAWAGLVDLFVKGVAGASPRKHSFSDLSKLPAPIRELLAERALDPATLVAAAGDAGVVSSPKLRVSALRRLLSLAWLAPAVAAAADVPFSRFWKAASEILDEYAADPSRARAAMPPSASGQVFFGGRAHPELGHLPGEVVAGHMLAAILSGPHTPPLSELDRLRLSDVCRALHRWVKAERLNRHRIDVPEYVVNSGFGVFSNPRVTFGVPAGKLERWAALVGRSASEVAPVVASTLGLFKVPLPSPAAGSLAAVLETEMASAAASLPSTPQELVGRWVSAVSAARHVPAPPFAGTREWDPFRELHAVVRAYTPKAPCVALWAASVHHSSRSHPDPRVAAACLFVDPVEGSSPVSRRLRDVICPGVAGVHRLDPELLSFRELASLFGYRSFVDWLSSIAGRFFPHPPTVAERLDLVGDLLADPRPAATVAALRGVSLLERPDRDASEVMFAAAAQPLAALAAMLPTSVLSEPDSPEAEAWVRAASRLGAVYASTDLFSLDGELGSAFDDLCSVVFAAAPHLAQLPSCLWDRLAESPSSGRFWAEVAASRHAALFSRVAPHDWPAPPVPGFAPPAEAPRTRPDFDQAVLSLAVSDAELFAGPHGFFSAFGTFSVARESLPLGVLLGMFPSLRESVVEAFASFASRPWVEIREFSLPDHEKFFTSMARHLRSHGEPWSGELSRSDICWVDVLVASVAAVSAQTSHQGFAFQHLPPRPPSDVFEVVMSLVGVRTPTHPRSFDDSDLPESVPVLAKVASGVGSSTALSKPASALGRFFESHRPDLWEGLWGMHRDLTLEVLSYCDCSWLESLCYPPHRLPAAAKRVLLGRTDLWSTSSTAASLRASSPVVWGSALGLSALEEALATARTHPQGGSDLDVLSAVREADADGSAPLCDGPSMEGAELVVSAQHLAELAKNADPYNVNRVLDLVVWDLSSAPLPKGDEGVSEFLRRLDFLASFSGRVAEPLTQQRVVQLLASEALSALWGSVDAASAAPLLDRVCSLLSGLNRFTVRVDSLFDPKIPIWVAAGALQPDTFLSSLPLSRYADAVELLRTEGAELSLWVPLLGSWSSSMLSLIRTAASL